MRDVSGLIDKRDDGMFVPDALGNNGFDTVTDDEPDNDNSGTYPLSFLRRYGADIAVKVRTVRMA